MVLPWQLQLCTAVLFALINWYSSSATTPKRGTKTTQSTPTRAFSRSIISGKIILSRLGDSAFGAASSSICGKSGAKGAKKAHAIMLELYCWIKHMKRTLKTEQALIRHIPVCTPYASPLYFGMKKSLLYITDLPRNITSDWFILFNSFSSHKYSTPPRASQHIKVLN